MISFLAGFAFGLLLGIAIWRRVRGRLERRRFRAVEPELWPYPRERGGAEVVWLDDRRDAS